MNLNFETIEQELLINKKAIIRTQNNRFLIKKSEDGTVITPKYNFLIEYLIHAFMFILSSFIIFLILTILAELMDYYEPVDYSDTNSISYSGVLQISAKKYWYVYIAIFLIAGNFSYNKLMNLIMAKFYSKEKTIILIGLNEIETPPKKIVKKELNLKNEITDKVDLNKGSERRTEEKIETKKKSKQNTQKKSIMKRSLIILELFIPAIFSFLTNEYISTLSYSVRRGVFQFEFDRDNIFIISSLYFIILFVEWYRRKFESKNSNKYVKYIYILIMVIAFILILQYIQLFFIDLRR